MIDADNLRQSRKRISARTSSLTENLLTKSAASMAKITSFPKDTGNIIVPDIYASLLVFNCLHSI